MFSFWHIVTHSWVVDPPTTLKSTKILVQIYKEHFYLLEIKKKYILCQLSGKLCRQKPSKLYQIYKVKKQTTIIILVKTNHSTENKVVNLTEAFTSIYLHCTRVHMCILHWFYVYLLINWLFIAIKNITNIDFCNLICTIMWISTNIIGMLCPFVYDRCHLGAKPLRW